MSAASDMEECYQHRLEDSGLPVPFLLTALTSTMRRLTAIKAQDYRGKKRVMRKKEKKGF